MSLNNATQTALLKINADVAAANADLKALTATMREQIFAEKEARAAGDETKLARIAQQKAIIEQREKVKDLTDAQRKMVDATRQVKDEHKGVIDLFGTLKHTLEQLNTPFGAATLGLGLLAKGFQALYEYGKEARAEAIQFEKVSSGIVGRLVELEEATDHLVPEAALAKIIRLGDNLGFTGEQMLIIAKAGANYAKVMGVDVSEGINILLEKISGGRGLNKVMRQLGLDFQTTGDLALDTSNAIAKLTEKYEKLNIQADTYPRMLAKYNSLREESKRLDGDFILGIEKSTGGLKQLINVEEDRIRQKKLNLGLTDQLTRDEIKRTLEIDKSTIAMYEQTLKQGRVIQLDGEEIVTHKLVAREIEELTKARQRYGDMLIRQAVLEGEIVKKQAKREVVEKAPVPIAEQKKDDSARQARINAAYEKQLREELALNDKNYNERLSRLSNFEKQKENLVAYHDKISLQLDKEANQIELAETNAKYGLQISLIKKRLEEKRNALQDSVYEDIKILENSRKEAELNARKEYLDGIAKAQAEHDRDAKDKKKKLAAEEKYCHERQQLLAKYNRAEAKAEQKFLLDRQRLENKYNHDRAKATQDSEHEQGKVVADERRRLVETYTTYANVVSDVITKTIVATAQGKAAFEQMALGFMGLVGQKLQAIGIEEMVKSLAAKAPTAGIPNPVSEAHFAAGLAAFAAGTALNAGSQIGSASLAGGASNFSAGGSSGNYASGSGYYNQGRDTGSTKTGETTVTKVYVMGRRVESRAVTRRVNQRWLEGN